MLTHANHPAGVSVIERLCADALVAAERQLEARIVERPSVDSHPEVTRVFHRELTRLKVMFCWLCWRQDMGGLPFRGSAAFLVQILCG